MNRKDLIDKIVKHASLFVQEVKTYTAVGNYDINIHAENALIPILNAVFDINLVNVNQQKKNNPAVDLIDETNGIAFQVTSTASIDKVVETIEKFVSHKLYEKYPVLYIYILTERDNTYNLKKIKKALNGTFEFNPDVHIVDHADILKRINFISSLEKIQTIARLYEHEFSDVQLHARERIFKDGFLKNTFEPIYLNLVKISFSNRIFIASPSLDKENLLTKINIYLKQKGRPPVKNVKPEKVFKQALRDNNIYNADWVLRENKVITFRNLSDINEPMHKVIDVGTVESFSPEEYYLTSEDHLNIFKDLLRRCLCELCYKKEMEWVPDRYILRFRNDRDMPREKSTVWVGKKASTKTVIFELMSKKTKENESHIICFRNMAFKPSFHLIDDEWYLCINPTWSFTNPGGQKTSRFEPDYMTGIKRLENNNTVYYQFRFFAYYLSYTPPMFYESYPHLTIDRLPPIEFKPSMDDSKWRPPKEYAPQNVRELELQYDNELKPDMF